MLDNQMNINSDSKPVAKMANVLKRFEVPLYLGMSTTVVGNRLSNFASNVSRGMLKYVWNVMRRMIEGFNRNYVLQKELSLLNRKLSGSSGTPYKKQKFDNNRPLTLAK